MKVPNDNVHRKQSSFSVSNNTVDNHYGLMGKGLLRSKKRINEFKNIYKDEDSYISSFDKKY